MEFKKKILPNGLCVIGELNRSARSAAVGFFVKTGSRDENKQINGVSHFLEHMVFKGTERLNAFQVNNAFDKTGAQFNAFTSEEATVFYAAVLPEYLAEVTKLWTELMRPALRDSDFDMEKNVICQEISMYKDMPDFDVMDRCRALHFDGHPCGNSVLGSRENIEALTAEQMRDYFDRRYAANNMVLAFVGNFDWQQVCSIAENNCAEWRSSNVKRELSDYRGSGKTERITKPDLSCEHICLMSPAVSASDDGRFAASVLASVVGDNTGSRYFWELVDKAIAETATMQFAAMDGTGAFCSYIRCGRGNSEKVMEIIKRILRSLTEKGITEDELQKAKNKILSAMVIKNEVPMGRLVDFGFNWLYLEQHRTVKQDAEAVKAATVDDVQLLAERFEPADFTKFSIGPAEPAGDTRKTDLSVT